MICIVDDNLLCVGSLYLDIQKLKKNKKYKQLLKLYYNKKKRTQEIQSLSFTFVENYNKHIVDYFNSYIGPPLTINSDIRSEPLVNIANSDDISGSKHIADPACDISNISIFKNLFYTEQKVNGFDIIINTPDFIKK